MKGQGNSVNPILQFQEKGIEIITTNHEILMHTFYRYMFTRVTLGRWAMNNFEIECSSETTRYSPVIRKLDSTNHAMQTLSGVSIELVIYIHNNIHH
jgi:hypothetical protein